MTDLVHLYICAYFREHGYAPSVREIADGVGLRSTAAVQHHLTKLIEAGAIRRVAGLSRAMAVVRWVEPA